jgi:GGDEF domain-containing protein
LISLALSPRYADRICLIMAAVAREGERATACFGVACPPKDVPASAEELLHSAHASLFAAKRRSRNSVASYESTSPDAVPAGGMPGA